MKSKWYYNPIYWLACLLLVPLYLIAQLPFRFQMFLGKCLGYAYYFFSRQGKEIARINVKLCYPELTPQLQKAMVKEHFVAIGLFSIELGMCSFMPRWRLLRLAKKIYIHHDDRMDEGLANGNGVLLLASHLTCLEMLGCLYATRRSIAVVYRPGKNPFFHMLNKRMLERNFAKAIPNTDMRTILKSLKNNEIVTFMPDIDPSRRNKRAVFAPFFGVPAFTVTNTSRIAKVSRAIVLPMGYYRTQNNSRYEGYFYPALKNFPTDDDVADATVVNAALEKMIRHSPGQYLWQYRRFKTRPDGQEKIYE